MGSTSSGGSPGSGGSSIPLAQKGAPNGVATLDVDTLIPDAQIPASIARDSEVTGLAVAFAIVLGS